MARAFVKTLAETRTCMNHFASKPAESDSAGICLTAACKILRVEPLSIVPQICRWAVEHMEEKGEDWSVDVLDEHNASVEYTAR